MLRISTAGLSSLFAIGLVTGCADEIPVDELAGETAEDGEPGKGDAVDAFTFFTIQPDMRACSPDPQGMGCTGFYVARPNRATTSCGGGVSGARCYVDSLDMSGTAMPPSIASMYEDRIRAGEPLIVRGEIVPDPDNVRSKLLVTEIWLPGSADGVLEGVAVLVRDNGMRCTRSPCASLTELRLNSYRFAQITDLYLESTPGVTEAAVIRAFEAVFGGGDGVLVFGDRFYPEERGATGRAANQFYTRAPVPQF